MSQISNPSDSSAGQTIQVEALIVQTQPGRGRETAERCYLVTIRATADGATIGPPRPIPGPSSLADMLWDAPTCERVRTLRLFTLRGWPDWVLCGLTELLDAGRIVYRYLTLDGARSTLRGHLSGRPILVTSLPCWTGPDWRLWAESIGTGEGIPVPTGPEWECISTENIHYVRTVAAVCAACATLDSGALATTASAQARQLWRRWLGLQVPCRSKDKRIGNGSYKETWKCVPLADTPSSACAAARLASYGLPITQFQAGHAGARVYVWDIQSAYLTALLHAPLPAIYGASWPRPRLDALTEQAASGTALALVRIAAAKRALATKISGRTEFCCGTFWTWLCGRELEAALRAGLVTDCEHMYTWRSVRYDEETAHCLMQLGQELDRTGRQTARKLWRSCYSSICGSWATWVQTWRDTGRKSPLGPWASWTEHDPQTGSAIHWRAVAGRVQVRETIGDGNCARPIAYACVTAAVREAVEIVRRNAPLGSVLCCAMDAVWLSERGHRWMAKCASINDFGPWTWKHKETYEDLWMDGDSRAVAQVGGSLIPVCPGVPQDAVIEPDGRARWRVAAPWYYGGKPSATKGVAYRSCVWNAERLVRACDYPLREARPWLEMSGGAMREELLI